MGRRGGCRRILRVRQARVHPLVQRLQALPSQRILQSLEPDALLETDVRFQDRPERGQQRRVVGMRAEPLVRRTQPLVVVLHPRGVSILREREQQLLLGVEVRFQFRVPGALDIADVRLPETDPARQAQAPLVLPGERQQRRVAFQRLFAHASTLS